MALSYMWSLSIPQPGTTLAMSTEFFRLLFYTLVIVVAIAAAAGLAEARAAGNRRAALATCWFLLPLAVSVIIATIMPVLGQRDTENGVRCTDHPGFRLCLYPNDERGRRFVAESVAVIADPLPACEPCRPSPSLRSTSPQSNRPTSSTGSAPPEPTGFRSSIETVRASTSARRADHRRRSRATPSSKAFFTVLVKRAAQRHPEVSEIVGSELSPNVDEQALQAFPRLDDQAFIAWYAPIKASSSTAPFRRRTSLDGHLSRLDARPEPQPRHGLARAVHRSHVCRVVGVIQRPMGNLRTPPLPPDVRAAPDPRRNRSPVRHAAPDRLDRPAGSQTGRELRRLRGRHRMRHGGAVARLHPVADQPVAGLRHLPARRHTHEGSDDARPVRAHHPLLGIQRERRRRAGPGLPRHRPDRQNARTRDRHPLPVAAPFKAKTSSSSCPETTSALPSFPYPRGQEWPPRSPPSPWVWSRYDEASPEPAPW